MRHLFLLGFFAMAAWSQTPPVGPAAQDSTTRTLWLDVGTPQGSDISDWIVLQAEQAFAGESGIKVITRAERLRAAAGFAAQPGTRLANADSLYRLERKPDFWISLSLDPIRAEDGRAGWLFFMGRRTVTAAADFVIRSSRGDMPDLQGRLTMDTSWTLDYCGMLECVNTPFPAVERLPIEKTLVLRLVTQLRDRMHQALTIPLRDRTTGKTSAPQAAQPQ